MLVTGSLVELPAIQQNRMPEVFHHDAELTDFLRVGTSREVFSRVRVREGNYMKSHAEILARFYFVGDYLGCELLNSK
jgi:hypothetical protein